MSRFPKYEHKCRSSLKNQWTPGFNQHFKQGQGTDYFLYQIFIIIVQFG